MFPPIRPICSGHNGPTAHLSEFLDTFLKAAAVKTSSYIRDSAHFINKISTLILPSDSTPILVTMDVISLYPNIDQDEGTAASEHFLNQRSSQFVPTDLLRRLIMLVLRSTVVQFGTKFYRQIKGTAMGSDMAVNYANLFMTKLEHDMLREYEQLSGKRPLIWLRFIDDIFFVWLHDETSLKEFITFCNNYTISKNLKSTIKYTSHFSTTQVTFLDITVNVEGNHLSTDLHSKPTSTHTYLHSSSFDPPSTIRSLPKTQFIRIRIICTHIGDFDRHAAEYVQFFKHRGYKENYLRQCRNEIRAMNRRIIN